jgi:hypothetical protein
MKSKKYIENRSKSKKIKLIEEPTFAAMMAGSAVSGAAGSALMAGIPIAVEKIGGIMSHISQSIARFKHDRFGCKRIVDQDQRDRCEARQIDVLLTDLRNSMSKCAKVKDVQGCKERINKKIIQYTQERQKLLYGDGGGE